MDDLTEAQQNEYRAAAVAAGDDGRPIDGRNRTLAATMTDREIAEESLILLRAFGDALQALGDNPMLRALPGMRGMFSKS